MNNLPYWQIYEFVCHYVQQTGGRFPTLREIMSEAGISSTSQVYAYLDVLRHDGLLTAQKINGRRRYSIAGQQVVLPTFARQAAREWEQNGNG